MQGSEEDRNMSKSYLFVICLIFTSFTGCMSDEESLSDEVVEIIVEDDIENSQDGNTTASNNTDDTNNDETSEVYDGPLKILALHGGGDTPEGLESQSGMQALMADLPEFEFFFADAPDDDSICDQCWYGDPPGGKDEPNEDRNWADGSIAYLDQVVADHGPFYGILGYSQGVPMATVYLANSNATFQKAMLFNGYLPTTHSGLNDTINEAAPLDTPALIFGGEEDVFIFGVEELEGVYAESTVLVSSTADHHLPYSDDETYDQVLAFFREVIDNAPEPIVTPSKLWMSTVEGSQEESHGHFILATEDGGFLQIGETGFIPNSAKILVAKIDSEGDFVWKKEFGAVGHNLGNSAIEISDGYVVVGSMDEDSTIMKLNKDNGSIIFSSTYNVGGSDAFENIVEISSGFAAVGYINAEDRENTFYTEGEGHMAFLDTTGNIISVKSLNDYMSQAYRIGSYNNELIISGLTEEALDYALIKMDTDGNVIWSNTYGGDGSDHNFAFDIAPSGTVFLSGHTTSGTENWDTYTMRIGNDGELIWENKTGNPRGFDPEYIHDEVWGLKATGDGGVIVVAGTGDEYEEYSECNGDDCSDSWRVYVIKYSDDGTLEWELTFGPSAGGDWAGEDICLTSDEGAVVAVDNGAFGFLRLTPF